MLLLLSLVSKQQQIYSISIHHNIFLQCQGSFINHFQKTTVIQTAFAITTKYSFKSDKHLVILTAYVVINNEFQKYDACRSVIQKLNRI